MLRINAIACLLLVLFGCSKTGSDSDASKKADEITSKMDEVSSPDKTIYKTVIVSDLEIYSSNPMKGVIDKIGTIPFKEKIEIIENEAADKYSKVKYKKTVGYVLSSYLSDKDDVPFVDDVKYDYKLNEFDYDREVILKTVINHMYKYYKDEVQYYYMENPQIFTFYAKDCDDLEVKRVIAIMVSKITPIFNKALTYDIEDDKLVAPRNFHNIGLLVTIDKVIESARHPDCQEY